MDHCFINGVIEEVDEEKSRLKVAVSMLVEQHPLRLEYSSRKMLIKIIFTYIKIFYS